MKLILDIGGWIGMIMVVTGYYLVSNGKIEARTNTFQLINLVAAFLIGLNALYYGAMPSVGLNAVWILIAIVALGRNNRKQT